jgi:hypothetical protein
MLAFMPAQLRLIKPDEPREYFHADSAGQLWAGLACVLGAVELTTRGYGGALRPLLAGPAAASLLFLAAWFAFTWAERMCTSYWLGSKSLVIGRGILRQRVETVELWRIREARLEQSAVQRLRGAGGIALVLHDPSRPVLVLGPVAAAEKLHRKLRETVARDLTPSAEPARDRR